MPQQPLHRAWWVVAAAVLLTGALIAGWASLNSESDPVDPPTETDEPTTSAERTPPPPEPEPPVAVTDRSPLTLPQEVRLAEGEFYLREGRTYVVIFELSTVKPESAPGIGMYLGVTFSCGQQDGVGMGSIGGTENLLPGEPVTYRNQLVLRPQADGVHECSVLANAPYDDVAAKGTTAQISAEWEATEVRGDAFEVDSEEQLPAVVADDEQASPLVLDLPGGDLESRSLEVLTTLHVTTCTGAPGSREAGRIWCTTSDIDEIGSTIEVTVSADIVREDDTVCRALRSTTESVEIDKWRHHDVIPISLASPIPDALCGDRVRITASIDNSGPASLVVHEKNTSLVAVAEE